VSFRKSAFAEFFPFLSWVHDADSRVSWQKHYCPLNQVIDIWSTNRLLTAPTPTTGSWRTNRFGGRVRPRPWREMLVPTAGWRENRAEYWHYTAILSQPQYRGYQRGQCMMTISFWLIAPLYKQIMLWREQCIRGATYFLELQEIIRVILNDKHIIFPGKLQIKTKTEFLEFDVKK